MQTSEVLNKAADLIEERGWTKGNAGWAAEGPVCLEGALVAATDATYRQVNVLAFWACRAYQAVMEYLERDSTIHPAAYIQAEPLWQWNDAQRTADEVIETLRAAALVEAAREDAALLAEVGRP